MKQNLTSNGKIPFRVEPSRPSNCVEILMNKIQDRIKIMK